MIWLHEGEKRYIKAKLLRLTGSGAITLTSPERRILTSARVVASGFNWAAATWDSANSELVALFDSTVAALSTPGHYYVQLRGVIASELYATEIKVEVLDWGP